MRESEESHRAEESGCDPRSHGRHHNPCGTDGPAEHRRHSSSGHHGDVGIGGAGEGSSGWLRTRRDGSGSLGEVNGGASGQVGSCGFVGSGDIV